MKTKWLIHNARIYTQAEGLVVDSLAVYRNRIVAVGNNLEHDPDFSSYQRLDLKGKTVTPGLIDAHTHFYFFALSLGRVNVDGLSSLDATLDTIGRFAKTLKKHDWVVGEGYAPDRFKRREEPTAAMLDRVTGTRPAFIFSKDQHSAWVNSRALKLAGITQKTKDPVGGKIERDADGEPIGILREGPAISLVFDLIPPVPKREVNRRYALALQYAYRKGVTGVTSFDGLEAHAYWTELATRGKMGLRVSHYLPASHLPEMAKNKIYYGTGDDFYRIAGVKIFADGSLGSQTALCFNSYIGSRGKYGIEVAGTKEIARHLKAAAKLNHPAAVHAIGDKAVSNVLDAMETVPRLSFGARHRIEHVQLMRRADVPRMQKLGVTASVQPSHCPADIDMIRAYWGKRGANAYIFRTFIDKGIPVAFGSDCPIEPLDPIAGIAAAVRRARRGKRDVFYPEQKVSATEALYAFTVGAYRACGQEHNRGYLLPGYPADLVILDRDVTRIAPTRIYDTNVLATFLDGKSVYCDPTFAL